MGFAYSARYRRLQKRTSPRPARAILSQTRVLILCIKSYAELTHIKCKPRKAEEESLIHIKGNRGGYEIASAQLSNINLLIIFCNRVKLPWTFK